MTRLMIVLILVLLACSGCSDNQEKSDPDSTAYNYDDPWNWRENLPSRLTEHVTENDSIMQFALTIQEHVCCPYESFDLYWHPDQGDYIFG